MALAAERFVVSIFIATKPSRAASRDWPFASNRAGT